MTQNIIINISSHIKIKEQKIIGKIIEKIIQPNIIRKIINQCIKMMKQIINKIEANDMIKIKII